MTGADVQATFCATLVDEWIGRGVRHAVVAPGSRSTPMALALAGRDELAVHVVHDERVAAFVALGLGLSGTPALLLCTSGTAATNFHPAVVEAGLSAVAMIVLTADRPPELRHVGAPQTIDQTHLYGRAVRWFHDPGVPDGSTSNSWRSLARRSASAAADGPVHLNLSFREPLLGVAGQLPPVTTGSLAAASRPVPAIGPGATAIDLVRRLDRRRGVILAGGRGGAAADDVARLAASTQWPVLADPTSGMRHLEAAVSSFDGLLRDEGFAAEHRPEIVVRVGRPASSKVLAQWVAASGATLVQIGGPGEIDPDHQVALRLGPGDLGLLADSWSGATGTSWAQQWRDADTTAEVTIGAVLDDESSLSEPAVARVVAEHLPVDAELVVASSMPVRDLEWFGGRAARAHANRGANGIDGVMSTAVGLALRGRTTVALVGDLAFLHDAGALTALAARGADVRIVVVDNDGGGIFSFLPQASVVAPERFEQLFGTPHGTDLVALASAHGLDAATVTTPAELVARLGIPGPSVTRIATDRAANVATHHAVNAAIVAALQFRGGSAR